MLAGLAWPFLLINWRRPSILELVLHHHQDLLEADDSFSGGLAAAMMMWVDCTGGRSAITKLLEHRPDPSRPKLCRAWNRLLAAPCEMALSEVYPILKKQGRLEEIFR